ncbi:hypothetical protein D047_0646A, partial [Vibrio parahaemolyticus VPTS-2010_2]
MSKAAQFSKAIHFT